MKLKNIQFTIIAVGSILVSLPLIAREIKLIVGKVEQYNYFRQLSKIEEYITKISESKKPCTIELKENVVESDCAKSLKLSKHIVLEPLTLNYSNGLFEGEEILLVSSRKYPEQYCMGFSGFMVAVGYYDGGCNSFENQNYLPNFEDLRGKL